MVKVLFETPPIFENVKLTDSSVIDVLAPRSSVVLGEVRCVSTGASETNVSIGIRDVFGTTYYLRKDKPLPPGEGASLDGPIALSAGELLQVQSSKELGEVDVTADYFVTPGRTP
jgi:hypothetical protein